MADEVKFSGYTGAKFINTLMTREQSLSSQEEDLDMMTKKEKDKQEKLGYREVTIDLWDNSCLANANGSDRK